MKKYLFPGGGQPTNLSDFQDFHDEIITVINNQGLGIGACVLSGLVISGVVGSANISSGWVFLDGEYFKLPAQTGVNFTANPTQYIKKGTATNSRSKNFDTGGLKNTRTEILAVITTTLPVSGEYITIKFAGHNQSLYEVLGRKINPIGTILMKSSTTDFDTTTGLGSGAWKGWSLCNGLNGTPNLEGRFVVGFDPDVADYSTVGNTGGAKDVTLDITQIPAHTHGTALGGNGQNGDLSTPLKAAVTDNRITDNGLSISTSAGGGLAHENRPPYYVLAYVMKIS